MKRLGKPSDWSTGCTWALCRCKPLLGEGHGTHSSTLAWKIPRQRSLVGCSPWGRYQSDTTERLHFHFSCTGEGNGNPLWCSCLENPRDGEAWWAAVYGVPQSRIRLKRLSSSSSSKPPLCCLWCQRPPNLFFHWVFLLNYSDMLPHYVIYIAPLISAFLINFKIGFRSLKRFMLNLVGKNVS